METTGRTIEEAKEAALDELGVDDMEAEFEVIEEPKAGLFGRVRKEARVRARVKPTKPRTKTDRRGRKRPKSQSGSSESDNGDSTDSNSKASDTKSNASPKRSSPKKSGAQSATKKQGTSGSSSNNRADEREESKGEKVSSTGISAEGQAEIVSEFLEGLLGAVGLDGEVASEKVDEGIYEVEVNGDDLGILIGPRGQTLKAIQDLGRTVVQRRVQGGIEGRVYVDIGGYRKKRREALERFTIGLAEEVRETGEAKALEPMNPADRKVVHDTVNRLDGVTTKSEGEDDDRHVVIIPTD